MRMFAFKASNGLFTLKQDNCMQCNNEMVGKFDHFYDQRGLVFQRATWSNFRTQNRLGKK